MCKTQVKEINSTYIIKTLESDFADITADNPVSKEDLYLCKRWRTVQFLANDSKMEAEVPAEPATKKEMPATSQNAQVDDIVIVQDDSSPRNEWKLARVVEAHPNADCRV